MARESSTEKWGRKASCKQYLVQRSFNNITCLNYGGPIAIGEMSFNQQHLRIKNARLSEEEIVLGIVVGLANNLDVKTLVGIEPKQILKGRWNLAGVTT